MSLKLFSSGFSKEGACDRRVFLKRLGDLALASSIGCGGELLISTHNLHCESIPMRTEDQQVSEQVLLALKAIPKSTDNIQDMLLALPFLNAIHYGLTGDVFHPDLRIAFECPGDLLPTLPDRVAGAVYIGEHKTILTHQVSGFMTRGLWLGVVMHESGHAYDHLELGDHKNEFCSTFFELCGSVLIDRSIPPPEKQWVSEGEKFDANMLMEENLSASLKLLRMSMHDAYLEYHRQLTQKEAPILSYGAGTLNAYGKLVEAGGIQGAFELIISRDKAEFLEESQKPRSLKEFAELLRNGLEILKQEMLSGVYGKKLTQIVFTDPSKKDESTVFSYVDYLFQKLEEQVSLYVAKLS
ncbi:MAG: hypothetical protein AABW86_04610 [Candidatus Micrarchaeota archaeon]